MDEGFMDNASEELNETMRIMDFMDYEIKAVKDCKPEEDDICFHINITPHFSDEVFKMPISFDTDGTPVIDAGDTESLSFSYDMIYAWLWMESITVISKLGDDTIKPICIELEKTKAELLEWENIEGRICPEDVGIAEYTTRLESQLTEKQAVQKRCAEIWSVISDVLGIQTVVEYAGVKCAAVPLKDVDKILTAAKALETRGGE
jgi:hypothetical protein